MKTVKKISVLFMTIVCMCMVCGCTKNVGTTQDNASANLPDEEEEEVQENYKIGFSVIDMENPYFITLEAATREYLEEQGCTLITKDPGTDQYLQAKQILDTENRDKYRIYGELINTYGYGLEEGAKELECFNYYTNEEIKIPLDSTKSAKENAQKYFDKYNKQKLGKFTLKGRLLGKHIIALGGIKDHQCNP